MTIPFEHRKKNNNNNNKNIRTGILIEILKYTNYFNSSFKKCLAQFSRMGDKFHGPKIT